jgi:hypothetical protein
VEKFLILPLKIKHSGGFPGNVFAAEQPAVSLFCSACATHNEKNDSNTTTFPMHNYTSDVQPPSSRIQKILGRIFLTTPGILGIAVNLLTCSLAADELQVKN